MQTLIQELRYTLRQLYKSPGFATTAVLTLALGIGAATSIFSVVEAVLLRPLPFHDPDRLVLVQENVTKLGDPLNLPAPDVLTFSREAHAFDSMGGFLRGQLELSGNGDPAQIASARLSADVFPTLGVAPMLGRTFTQQEDDQGQTVAVLSYGLWKSRFQGDPAVIGQQIQLDRKPYVVIGVMPRAFEFPLVAGKLNQTQLWVPMSFTPKEKADLADNWQYGLVARIKSGTSQKQAEQDAARVAGQIQQQAALTMSASLMPLKESSVQQARPLVRVLFLAVMVVLLIACANLAGLLLVRAIRRHREIALRVALGARSRVLLRQAMLESLVVSIAGGILGILLAAAALHSWVSLLPETLPRVQEIGLDGMVVGFALAVTLATGFLCGIAPAFAAMRTSVNDALKEGARNSSGAGHARLRSILVVGEIATALVLLTAAGLLVRSFARMRSVDPGFQPEHTVVASISLPAEHYHTQTQVDGFDEELLRRLSQLPGTQSVALTSALPMAEPNSTRTFTVEHYIQPAGTTGFNMESNSYVVGDYFRTMRIPLVRGRYVSEADKATSPLVVVVNRSLAEHYWPGEDPIGKRIKWGPADSPAQLPWLTVIGEVADTKQGALDSDDWAQAYEPLSQLNASFGPIADQVGVRGRDMRIALRTAMEPEQIENSIRQTVWSLDRQLAITRMQSMEEAISETEAPRRFNTMVLTAFALGAVLLAVLGIYAVIAFSAAQRIQEMAIRMALGAQRSNVMRLVLATGIQLAGAGCAIGLIGGLIASRLLRSFLFKVSPFDPVVFIVAIASVVVLTLIASLVPARRVASIDPMQALRTE